jgi:type I restriction enzyme S subunit
MDISNLSLSNYISTENMFPNRGGISDAANLPTISQVPAYIEKDVLVSNIRPYFKKIWYATFSGGCSNDVLVCRAKESVDPKFLYYILADDKFFDYSMATSKGTKMPRGDKKSIMEYGVPNFDLETQKKIAAILGALDDKIELNNKINDNLEQQAQTLFKEYFLNNPNPTWKKGCIGDIAEITSGKRPLMKLDKCDNICTIPLVGASSIMGYTNTILYDEKILVTGRVGTHGIIQRFSEKCWPSDNTLVIKSKYYEFIYQTLKNIDFSAFNRGSTQPLITQSDIKKIEIQIPDIENINEFERNTSSMFNIVEQNTKESQILAQLRDTLLPKLMTSVINL